MFDIQAAIFCDSVDNSSLGDTGIMERISVLILIAGGGPVVQAGVMDMVDGMMPGGM